MSTTDTNEWFHELPGPSVTRVAALYTARELLPSPARMGEMLAMADWILASTPDEEGEEHLCPTCKGSGLQGGLATEEPVSAKVCAVCNEEHADPVTMEQVRAAADTDADVPLLLAGLQKLIDRQAAEEHDKREKALRVSGGKSFQTFKEDLAGRGLTLSLNMDPLLVRTTQDKISTDVHPEKGDVPGQPRWEAAGYASELDWAIAGRP